MNQQLVLNQPIIPAKKFISNLDIYDVELINVELIKFKAFFQSSIVNVQIETTKDLVIEEEVFGQCELLTNINIRSKTTELPLGLCHRCFKLKNADFKNVQGLKKLNHDIFRDCHNLVNVRLPETVEEIGSCVFKRCFDLADIVIPANLKSIDYHAFDSCYNLKSLTLPSNIVYVSKDAFFDCVNLQEIKCSETTFNLNKKQLSRLNTPNKVKITIQDQF